MFKTQALIIKKQNYRETDRILTILTPEIGKKTVIVRGIRKPLSKLCGHLDTLMLSNIILTHDKELPTIISSVLIEPFDNIRHDLPKTERAMAILKIALAITLEDVNQERFFNLVIGSINQLDKDTAWQKIWLYFLAKVIDDLGLAPSDYSCGGCGQKITSGYRDSGKRLFYCTDCSGQGVLMNDKSLKLYKFLFENNFNNVCKIIFDDEVAESVESCLLADMSEWTNKKWASALKLAKS